MKKFKHYKSDEDLLILARAQAKKIFPIRHQLDFDIEDEEELAHLIFKLLLDKAMKDWKSDQEIDYNDEIVEIEELEEIETMDIGVSKDSLFYADGILTKNSMGLPFTLDLFIGLVSTDELADMNQVLAIPLKNRYGQQTTAKPFVIGIDYPKMRFYDVEQNDNTLELVNNQTSKPKFEEEDTKGWTL